MNPTDDEMRNAAAMARFGAITATESDPLWWLSFADDDGFRGACIVRAPDFLAAVSAARLHGCNPGGECRGASIPPSAMVPLTYEANKLYSKADIERIEGEEPFWWED